MESHCQARLEKECLTNLAIRMEPTTGESFNVKGRGTLQCGGLDFALKSCRSVQKSGGFHCILMDVHPFSWMSMCFLMLTCVNY